MPMLSLSLSVPPRKVAIEDADLVEIVPDFFHDVKIKAVGLPGTVKLQARTKDGKVLSNVAELTINL